MSLFSDLHQEVINNIIDRITLQPITVSVSSVTSANSFINRAVLYGITNIISRVNLKRTANLLHSNTSFTQKIN